MFLEIAEFYDYFEVHPNEDRTIIETLIKLGDEINKPVVATGDVYYLRPDDHITRNVLLYRRGYKELDGYCDSVYYFQTTEEMLEEFAFIGAEKAFEIVVTNTNKIADMIEKVRPIPINGLYYPEIDGAEGELMKISVARFHELYGVNPIGKVSKRLFAELDGINTNGRIASIYMIAKMLMDYARSEGYQISTRGSCGSSFVAYLLGITEVDPLEYDIPFEVFAGYERFTGVDYEKPPDFDFNLCSDGQVAAIKYLEEIVGKDNIIRAGTISTMQENEAQFYLINYCENEDFAPCILDARKTLECLRGVKKTTGVHPGGVFIMPENREIYDFTPVQHISYLPNEGFCTHFNYSDLEETLIKIDILGHNSQSKLKKLEKVTGVKVTTIKLDDEKTLDLLKRVDTLGIPEFDTDFAREVIIKTKPDSFKDFVKISGLCHGSGVWCNNADKLIETGVATLQDVISTRDEIMVYLMEKGFDREIAFTIMEDIRKGKGLSDEFADMMRKADIPDWYIDSCKKITYVFPKAHAVSYTMTAFRLGWFKAHYPEDFYIVSLEVASYVKRNGYLSYDIQKVKDELKEIEAIREKSGLAVNTSTYNNLKLRLEMLERGVGVQ
jgi:DNA polymerase-3 subunit alpha (Gram-positive type)